MADRKGEKMKKLGNLIQGQYTPAAMAIYLAVFEDRDWDCYFNYINGKGVYNNMFAGGRAEYREEWF